MSELPVISVQGLSKRYVIGHETRHDTFRDRIAHGVGGLFRRRAAAQASEEEFWALRDVSFDVKRGEVVGIIGRNGAGKSTLLKILSRITEPTTGRVSLRGRVASLLEVGTGFHPELTGRENIFLNGAILGMQHAEIRKKFDEIVAFAEVERFLDTPVKRYSSGMYVRLAFAVAAHLEPEILIVDEVLAVGDAAFQKKCLGKMREVSRDSSRTILFVSHNMAAIQQLCQRVIFLRGGSVEGDGDPLTQMSRYAGEAEDSTAAIKDLSGCERAYDPLGAARFLTARLSGADSASPWQSPFATPLRFEFTLDARTPMSSFELGVSISNFQGVELISTLSSWDRELGPINAGAHVASVDCGALELVPGRYRIGLGIKSDRGLEDHIPEAFDFEVVPSIHAARANLSSIRGSLAVKARCHLAPLASESTAPSTR